MQKHAVNASAQVFEFIQQIFFFGGGVRGDLYRLLCLSFIPACPLYILYPLLIHPVRLILRNTFVMFSQDSKGFFCLYFICIMICLASPIVNCMTVYYDINPLQTRWGQRTGFFSGAKLLYISLNYVCPALRTSRDVYFCLMELYFFLQDTKKYVDKPLL